MTTDRTLATVLAAALFLNACQPDDPVAPSGGGSGGGGNTSAWNWSNCPVEQRPIWFAYKDGDGDWNTLDVASGQFSFSITSEKGGVAYVTRDSEGIENTNVQYSSAAELNAGYQPCSSAGTAISLLGSATGLSSNDDEEWFDQGRIHLGPFAVGLAFEDVPSLVITGTRSGPEDLFAYRSRFSFSGTPPLHNTDRLIVRRNQNPANGATLPAFDFNGPEAFAAATSSLTIIGGTPDQIDMGYVASDDCLLKDGVSTLYSDIDVSSINVIAGIPASEQITGELHCLRILGSNPDWSVLRLFATMGPQTVQVPSMAAPLITPLTAGYARLQADYTVPASMYAAPYGNTRFSYTENDGNTVSINTSFAWLSSATVSSAPPEFDGLAGWDAAWWPTLGQPGTWGLSVQSTDFDCHEEGTSYTVVKDGTY